LGVFRDLLRRIALLIERRIIIDLGLSILLRIALSAYLLLILIRMILIQTILIRVILPIPSIQDLFLLIAIPIIHSIGLIGVVRNILVRSVLLVIVPAEFITHLNLNLLLVDRSLSNIA
jgi:hypothetical protein